MFNLLEDLTKVAVSVVKLPVTIIADAATLGGAIIDKDQPYTADALEDLVKNLENATRPR
ncbi:MAG: hypothetical protein ACRCWJ_05965 [Casimicrobium sp.]